MGKNSKLLEWAPFIGLVSRNRKYVHRAQENIFKILFSH